MNVIRHYLKGVYRSAQFGGFLFQPFFKPLSHRPPRIGMRYLGHHTKWYLSVKTAPAFLL
jgi:hypothetical protein